MFEPWVTLIYYLQDCMMRRSRTRQQLTAFQDRKVAALLAEVLPRSSFYQRHYAGHDLRDWRNLPVIDKQIMMEHFSELNVCGINKERAFAVAFNAERQRDFRETIDGIAVGLSSGTSGSRGIFLVSPRERCLWAAKALARILPAPILIRQRIAFFLRSDSPLYQTVRSKVIEFQFFDLSGDMDDHLKKLQVYNPTILIAPPSVLLEIARTKSCGRLTINPVKVISVAEVLDPMDEKRIRAAFGQLVHQVYQCTEGFLGVTCCYGKVHLNEDLVVFQKNYLDQGLGKFTPIITDMHRTTQPIIRYMLNDILTELKEPCPCGAVHEGLAFIEGRSDDLFIGLGLDGGQKIIYPDFIRRALIMSEEAVEEYVVAQDSFCDLRVFLKMKVLDESIKERVKTDLLHVIHTRQLKTPRVVFVPGRIATPSGKLKRVIRTFNYHAT